MPPLPASLPQPPFGSSPMTRPSGNPGEAANGAAMVQEAVNMLEKALALLPPGDPLHKVTLKSISDLSKHAPPAAASPGVGLMALKQMLAQQMKGSPLAPMQAGAGAAPGAGAGAPPTPPTAGAMPPSLTPPA